MPLSGLHGVGGSPAERLSQVSPPQNLRTLGEAQAKSEQQKELSSLGLLNTLFRTVHQEVGPR